MRKKLLKLITVVLLAVMLISNFSYLGAGIISYAANNTETNHQNIDFDVQIRDNNKLSLIVNVKEEGYFNGKITIDNSNFVIKDTKNQYVNKIEGNEITLNQINAGTSANIDLDIEPIKRDIYDIGLLNSVTKVNLNGIYKNKTNKDINIKATREVKLEIPENNTNENVESRIEILSNKILKVNNEDKRVVQLSLSLGLKDNNYPIKNIDTELTLPKTKGAFPSVRGKVNFNNMTNYNMKHTNENVNMNLTNLPNENNLILWRKTGNDNIVVSLIYDKDEKLDNLKIMMKETVTLQNGKKLVVNTESSPLKEIEGDALIQLDTENKENSIYKGKLYANVPRQFETKTIVKVNLPKAEENIQINEEASMYLINGKEQNANANYVQTIISKEQFDKILGAEGKITVKNGKEVIATIDATTAADKDNNLIINYLPEKNIETITIETTTPIETGNLEFKHIKEIKNQSANIVKEATEINTKINLKYNSSVTENTSKIKLEESKSDVVFTTNANNLSTVVENNVEMKVLLKTNNEMNNLFENPVIEFELPQEVENIPVAKAKLVYEDELKIKETKVVGNKIIVTLDGKQTTYKEAGIEGALIIVNAKLKLNKNAATNNGQIKMSVKNGSEVLQKSSDVRIIAPKDMTLVHSIKGLGVETTGEESSKTVTLPRGERNSKVVETSIEIINNNESTMNNVKIAGTFATNNNTNNVNIKIVEGFNVSAIKGAKVYYTENEKATEDIQNAQNGWKENITDSSKVRKFLVTIPEMVTQAKHVLTYKMEIPGLLEYNQKAYQNVAVNYTNSLAGEEKTLKGTEIVLDTGVGAKAEIKLKAKIGSNEIQNMEHVKNGEVIRVQMEIANIGSEDLHNVKTVGMVPEGTTLVRPRGINSENPEDWYEYNIENYYEELPDRKYEKNVNEIKVGKVVTLEYEVRVNNNVQPGTNIKIESGIKYGDVMKKSNEIQLATEQASIRVSVKKGTDRNIEIYDKIRYLVVVENTSNKTQENLKVKINYPESLEPELVTLITSTKNEETGKMENETKRLEAKNDIVIGDLKPGQLKVVKLDNLIDINSKDIIKFSATVSSNAETVRSNEIQDRVKKLDFNIEMISNTESQYIKSGDKVDYAIKVKNNGNINIDDLIVKDIIPKSLSVVSVSVDGETKENLAGRNNLEIPLSINGNEEKNIVISTVVNYSASRTTAETITNVAELNYKGDKIATTQEITHIIEADKDGTEEGDGSETDNVNPGEDTDVAKGENMITGMAWLDENANGIKDNEEKTLNNIEVSLYNPNTKNMIKDKEGNILKVTTNEHGVYVLDSIQKGNYIVIFNYDKAKYGLTKYKVEGTTEKDNSNALMNELIIGESKQEVPSTDIIKITDSNISDVNIGLIELKNFDLKLDKFVSKILVQNSAGTIVKEYNDETLAKVELKAKQVKGSNIIVEYTIKVTNIGEVEAYARKIVDYMPNTLKFSSELNKDWYQSGDNLYNISIANEIIKPGESKDLKLTLTKALNDDTELGRINNTAKIEECYSNYNINENSENNKGLADIIIGVSTGGIVWTTTIISLITALGVVVFIIIKKKNKKEI